MHPIREWLRSTEDSGLLSDPYACLVEAEVGHAGHLLVADEVPAPDTVCIYLDVWGSR